MTDENTVTTGTVRVSPGGNRADFILCSDTDFKETGGKMFPSNIDMSQNFMKPYIGYLWRVSTHLSMSQKKSVS